MFFIVFTVFVFYLGAPRPTGLANGSASSPPNCKHERVHVNQRFGGRLVWTLQCCLDLWMTFMKNDADCVLPGRPSRFLHRQYGIFSLPRSTLFWRSPMVSLAIVIKYYSHERELLAKFPFTFRGYVILQAADSMVSICTEIYSILDPPSEWLWFLLF